MAAPTVHPDSHVGFDSITSQIERKLLKRGFQFNVICVGESSLNAIALLFHPQQAMLCTAILFFVIAVKSVR